MGEATTKDRPGVIAPPPLIFAGMFLLGWLTRGFLPIREFHIPAVVLAVLAIALAIWGLSSMTRAKTHVDPYQPTTALVTTGPFGFSRNPLYLAMTLGYLSATLWTGFAAALLFLPIALVILQIGVVRREERYLEAKFAEPYRVYRSRVRRWL